MAENKYKDPVKESNGTDQTKQPGNRVVSSLLNGSFLSLDKSPGLLPFILFLTGLAVLLIANTYYAEKKVRQIEQLRHQVTEQRTIYISNKAELMYLSNQSEIARRLEEKGFVESTVPPRVLVEQKPRRSFLLRIVRGQK